MKNLIRKPHLLAVALFTLSVCSIRAQDPLPSWNDTGPKKAIVAFVQKVTREGSPDFVPVPERIATFDNDGTLWAEQPMYFQFLFAVDRVKELAPKHPEWKTAISFARFRLEQILTRAVSRLERSKHLGAARCGPN